MKTIGKATLYQVDCMEYMATLQDKAFELALVDPPYFDGPQKPGYYKGTKQRCDVGAYKDVSSSWTVPNQKYFDELKRVSRNQIIWGINYFDFQGSSGGRIVWIKGEQGSPFSMADIAYQSFYNRIDLFKYLWSGFWQEPGIQKEVRIHPTQKPTKLYEFLLTNYAKPGDRILDTHLGSGSSAIAANNLGFEFVGCELDLDYYNAACERIEHHTKQMRLFA
ncbi:DNA methyltransferase [Nitrosomonas sp. Nm132]|jgi:site-specific DNA-methyltransferase (adenine-specific)|uniref:DNA methyltransferase n=1 Tax=Nitrosomonas sp. Nm132 TaxID=1881053 RepID=UPI00088A537D|nr:DNA methyltransferase [Nitrosomonas sp. Nm132]SDH26129.1 site-specific DNA-methyltransferase (adenine-specific) [Nitrosomonas sp. Nm132]